MDGVDGEEETLYALNADLSATLDSAPLPANQYVGTVGYYDAATGMVYTAHMALAEVRVFRAF